MAWQPFIGAGLVALAILIAVFFIMREIMLWYWRINDIADSLDAINVKLNKLIQLQGGESVEVVLKHDQEVAATEESTAEEDPLGGLTVTEWLDKKSKRSWD